MDLQHDHPSGPMLGEAIVTALLHQLLSYSDPPLRTLERDLLSEREFKRLFDWIEANLPRPVSLEDLAREADVSLRHLHRAFLAATGLSPYKYILARRVERARRLIEGGQLSLSEIAGAVGFCSQAHMTHTFSKLLGVSPSQIGNRSKHSRS
jgi:AraC family transcriptional regulator